MPLHEKLAPLWTERAMCAFERQLNFNEAGVVLGKTVLARLEGPALAMNKQRILAMLSAAYAMEIPLRVIGSIERAHICWRRGDKVLAQMHLALIGLPLVDMEKAQRLFAAEWAFANGVTPHQLLKFSGLRKEDDDDDSDDDEDDGDDSSDDGDAGEGDNDEFDSKHPRWPAGAPGDIGGQFAPKDEAAATQALHDGIAAASSGSGSATQATPVTTNSTTAAQPAPKNPGAPSDGSEDRIDESYGLDGVVGALGH